MHERKDRKMAKKKKFVLEYMIKTLPGLLFTRLTTPSGLSEWFADDVNVKNDIYTFNWSGNIETAKLISKRNDEFMRFQWLDDLDTEAYFEFRIDVDPMTGEVVLVITDFCEDGDLKEATQLWNHQISDLKHNMGLI